jgi:hypothetical protein
MSRTTSVAALIALGALLGGLPGCGESCVVETYSCNGNQLEYCYPDDRGPVVEKTDCGDKFCRVVGTLGVCALEPDPNPACGDAGAIGGCDADGRLLTCQLGYITALGQLCAAPQVCLSKRGVSFCVLDSNPDPLCPQESTSYVLAFCNGTHAVGCQNGYRTSDTDCGTADLCYTPPRDKPGPWNGTCVVSLTPDPRCLATMPAYVTQHKSGCDGTRVFECVDDLLVGSQDCGAAGCTVTSVNSVGAASCGATSAQH